jgi:hypothetical protein
MKIAVPQRQKEIQQRRRPGEKRLRLVPEIEQACCKADGKIDKEGEYDLSTDTGVLCVPAEPCDERETEDGRSPHARVRSSVGIEMLTVEFTGRRGKENKRDTKHCRNNTVGKKQVFESHGTPRQMQGYGSDLSGRPDRVKRVLTVLQFRVVAERFSRFSKYVFERALFP